jgi:hypothetical protein
MDSVQWMLSSLLWSRTLPMLECTLHNLDGSMQRIALVFAHCVMLAYCFCFCGTALTDSGVNLQTRACAHLGAGMCSVVLGCCWHLCFAASI